MAQVQAFGPGNQVQEVPKLQMALLDSGISEEDVRDGGLVYARVYCCGRPMEKEAAIVAYTAPPA